MKGPGARDAGARRGEGAARPGAGLHARLHRGQHGGARRARKACSSWTRCRAALSNTVLAAIRSISDKPIHYIVNTQADEDHTGGNEALAKAGPTRPDRAPLASGLGGNTGGITSIIAHENVLKRMSAPVAGGGSARPVAAWPGDTFFNDENDFFFNDEAVQVLHQPNAHADGDSIVFFRRSDVIAAGDVFSTRQLSGVRQGAGRQHQRRDRRAEPDHQAGRGHRQHGRRHDDRPRPRPPQRQDGRRRVPEHGDDRPRPRPGARRPGQDARAGAGDAADARLRCALRRRHRAGVAARVRGRGVREPARNSCERRPNDVRVWQASRPALHQLNCCRGARRRPRDHAGRPGARGAPCRTRRPANREGRTRHRSRQVARGQPRGRLAGSRRHRLSAAELSFRSGAPVSGGVSAARLRRPRRHVHARLAGFRRAAIGWPPLRASARPSS